MKHDIIQKVSQLLTATGWKGPKLQNFEEAHWWHLVAFLNDILLEADQVMLLDVLESAIADSSHWLEEAAAETLPIIEHMHLDWALPQGCPFCAEELQALSFWIAKRRVRSTAVTESIRQALSSLDQLEKLYDLPDCEFELGGAITDACRAAGYDESGRVTVNNFNAWAMTVGEFSAALEPIAVEEA